MTALILSQPRGERLGGLEIRRFVQKYMGIGLGISVAIHFMLLATYQIATSLINHKVPQYVSIPIVLNPLPPPPIEAPQRDPMRDIVPPKPAPPAANIPKPIPGDAPENAPTIHNQKELGQDMSKLIDSLMQGIGDSPITITQPIPDDNVIPPPTNFSPFEQMAKLVKSVQPEYPALAKTAAVPGEVMVKLFVDEKGDVTQAAILQANPEGLGFDDEAIKAIKQWKFIPAIQDKHAVGVWLRQKIVFKIHE